MNSNDLAMELGTSSYKFAEFAGIPQGTELTGAEVEELTTKWYAEQHAAEDAEVAAMANIEYHEDGSETIRGAYGEPIVSEDHTEAEYTEAEYAESEAGTTQAYREWLGTEPERNLFIDHSACGQPGHYCPTQEHTYRPFGGYMY